MSMTCPDISIYMYNFITRRLQFKYISFVKRKKLKTPLIMKAVPSLCPYFTPKDMLANEPSEEFLEFLNNFASEVPCNGLSYTGDLPAEANAWILEIPGLQVVMHPAPLLDSDSRRRYTISLSFFSF